MSDRVIAVTGATGQQGGHVARTLLDKGWQVRALTRNPQKPAARELAGLGAEIVPGDLDSRPELDAAFQGVYGVFSMQNFWLPSVGYDGEIRQGKTVADAAKQAGVQHLVYSSVGAADRGMGQKHFESKWIIEQYIHTLALPYTIVRPAGFMENYNWSRPYILNGAFTGLGLRPGKTMQIIAVQDIGAFVEMAFAHPEQFLGKTIELAGDELTESQIAAVFTKVIGRPVRLVENQARGGWATGEEQAAVFNFFSGKGYDADIPALRAMYPPLQTLEKYLRRNGWENAEPVPIPEQAEWG
jgi:uncharacterized protein YbjT (DUF2867 family)